MNKHAFLIIAHKNPKQVQRLINLLDSKYCDIYIHIDTKCKFNFNELKTNESKLFLFSEIDVKWGTYSIVECELLLLKKSISNKYSYYHLLSGEDFICKSIHEIYNFFEESKKEFILFTNKKIISKDMDRVLYNHLMLGKLRSNKFKYINKLYFELDNIFVFILKLFRIKKKTYFAEYQKGSQWFSITSEFANYVINNSDLIEKAFNNTLIPDELFIQTLLINSKYKNNIYDYTNFNKSIQNSRLIDWNRGNPYTYRINDYEEIKSSGCCFLRKVSIEIDEELIKRLEDECTKNRGNL